MQTTRRGIICTGRICPQLGWAAGRRDRALGSIAHPATVARAGQGMF